MQCVCLVTQVCPTLVTPGTIAHQTPLSVGFSRQEHWRRLPFPTPGDLPDPGIEAVSLGSAREFFTTVRGAWWDPFPFPAMVCCPGMGAASSHPGGDQFLMEVPRDGSWRSVPRALHRWARVQLLGKSPGQAHTPSAVQPGLIERLTSSALQPDRERVTASPPSWRPGKRMQVWLLLTANGASPREPGVETLLLDVSSFGSHPRKLLTGHWLIFQTKWLHPPSCFHFFHFSSSSLNHKEGWQFGGEIFAGPQKRVGWTPTGLCHHPVICREWYLAEAGVGKKWKLSLAICMDMNTHWVFPGGSRVKNSLTMQETWVQSLSQEDLLEEEMATHPSILAWNIPQTEEPCRLQSMGSQKNWTQLSN